MARYRVRSRVTAALAVPAAAAVLAGALAATTLVAPPASAAVAGSVRVNQVGYAASGAKEAFLLAKGGATGAQYAVLNSSGTAVASGTIGSSLGSWNSTYPDVYLIDFTAVQAAGSYHIQVSGTATASSPTFRIGTGPAVFGPLTANAVAFFQAQRDGSSVIAGVLNRQPSHRNDASAGVYANPSFDGPDSDA